MTQQDSNFKVEQIAIVSISAGTVGATGMLILSAVLSLNWSLTLPLTFHLGATFAIVGAWMAASFATDSEMDEESLEHAVDAGRSSSAIRSVNKPGATRGSNAHSTAA